MPTTSIQVIVVYILIGREAVLFLKRGRGGICLSYLDARMCGLATVRAVEYCIIIMMRVESVLNFFLLVVSTRARARAKALTLVSIVFLIFDF